MSYTNVATFELPDGSTYSISAQAPPGKVITPNGFSVNRNPPGAPQIFIDAMKVRYEVFCNEQGCSAENEVDQDDPRSWHWVLYQSGTASQSATPLPKSVCVIRIVLPPHEAHPNGFEDPSEEPYVKLGRVATLKEHRGHGLSVRLCDVVWNWLAENPKKISSNWNGSVLTHAQVYVEKLYIKQGFTTDPRLGQWDEEGMMHLGMWKKIEIKS